MKAHILDLHNMAFPQVGLNSVLGGAVFVTSVVAGSVCLAVQPASPDERPVRLDFKCFLRDVGFFWFSLAALSVIIYSGKIHFLGAVGYLSIYILYGITVAVYELIKKRSRKKRRRQPILTSKPLLLFHHCKLAKGGYINLITSKWNVWILCYNFLLYEHNLAHYRRTYEKQAIITMLIASTIFYLNTINLPWKITLEGPFSFK